MVFIMKTRFIVVSLLVASLWGCSTKLTAPTNFIDNGKYTTDVSSGLDWLDLTETLNMSPEDVTEHSAPGMALEGWRFATHSEYKKMIGNFFGVPYKQVLRPSRYDVTRHVDIFWTTGNKDENKPRYALGIDEGEDLVWATFINYYAPNSIATAHGYIAQDRTWAEGSPIKMLVKQHIHGLYMVRESRIETIPH